MKSMIALIAHSLSIGIMCDLRKLQAFCCALMTAWLVFSVDTTRVEILETDPDIPGSDYINANYIRVSLFSIVQGHLLYSTVDHRKMAVTLHFQQTLKIVVNAKEKWHINSITVWQTQIYQWKQNANILKPFYFYILVFILIGEYFLQGVKLWVCDCTFNLFTLRYCMSCSNMNLPSWCQNASFCV